MSEDNKQQGKYDKLALDSFGVSEGVTFGNVVEDVVMAIPRAAEGIVNSVYTLGDALTFDALPDWDESRLFGRQKTIVGGLASGLLQWGVPFGGALKGATALSKGIGLAKHTSKVTGWGGKLALNYGKVTVAGAAADLVAFNGLEGRLADMAKEFGIENDLVNWLASDIDDTELEGRFKNVVEGSILGVGLDTAWKVFKASARIVKSKGSLKAFKALYKDTASVDDALTAYAAETEKRFREEFGYTPAQARVGRIMVEKMGLDVDADFGGILKSEDVEQLALGNADFDPTAKAVTSVNDAGMIFIGAIKDSNFSSGMHELAHVARRLFFDMDIDMGRRIGVSDEMINVAAKESGAVFDEAAGRWDWTTDAEESFARQFERWLIEGETTSPEMEGVFAAIGAWMRDVYKTLKGSDIDVELSDPMRKVFDQLVERGDLPELVTLRAAIGEPEQAVKALPNATPGPTIPRLDRDLKQDLLFQDDKKLREHQKALIQLEMGRPVDPASLGKVETGAATFNGTNGERIREATRRVMDRFKRPFRSAKNFERAIASFRGVMKDTVSYPKVLMRELKDGTQRKRIEGLSPEQVSAVDAGFSKVSEVGEAVKKDPDQLGMILFWSKLSAGLSPYPQEAAFLDLTEDAMSAIKLAREGKFDQDKWESAVNKKLNKYSSTHSPGNSAKHNANGYGKFLARINDAALEGRDLMEEIHTAWFSGDASIDVLYKYYDLIGGKGAGLDNKLLMFSRLVTGHDDVIVIDRLQEQSWWGLTDDMVTDYNAKIKEQGLPIEKEIGMGDLQAWIDGKMNQGDGLLFYQMLMRHMSGEIEELYKGTGRAPSLGRWHWETWLSAGEGSEVAHETLDFFLKGSKYDGGIRETRFGKFEYDVQYGPRPGDTWRLIASPFGGARIPLTGKQWKKIQAESKKGGAAAMVPPNFSIDKHSKNNGTPWHTAPGVYPEYLKLLAARESGVELARDATGELVHRPWTEAERDEINASIGLFQSGVRVRRWRSGRGPDTSARAYTRRSVDGDGLAGGAGLPLNPANKRAIKAIESAGAKIKATYLPTKEWTKASGATGDPGHIGRTLIHELDMTEPGSAKYAANLMIAARVGKHAWAVEVKSGEDLAKSRIFVSEDGKAMIGLDGPDLDNIMALTKVPGGTPVVAHSLLRVAIEEGGRKGDAFDGPLLTMYSAHGAVPVQRLTFDPQYAPPGMPDKYREMKPDVVHFVFEPDADLVYAPTRDKSIGKRAKSYDEAAKATSDAVVEQQRRVWESKGILLYQRANEIPTPVKGSKESRLMERSPAIQVAARRLRDGEIDRLEYDQVVATAKPVEPYAVAPKPATESAMREALGQKSRKLGAARDLPDGSPVDLRLDIPSYTRHKAWVVTVHGSKGNATVGPVIGYDSVARVDGGVTFEVGTPRTQEKSLDIAAGDMDKFPMATIRGKHKSVTPEEAGEMAARIVSGKEKGWTQVGFDPERHGYFYDRKSLKPIVSADEVIQVGPLVLARNAKNGAKEKFLYQSDGPDPRFTNRRRIPKSPDEILNMDRISTDLQIARGIETMVSQVFDQAAQARKTLPQQRADAEDAVRELQHLLGQEIVTEEMLTKLRNGALDTRITHISAELIALREGLASFGRQVRAHLDAATDPKTGEFIGGDREIAVLLRHGQLVQVLGVQVKKAQTELARALGAQRIRPVGNSPIRLPSLALDDAEVALIIQQHGGKAAATKRLKQKRVLIEEAVRNGGDASVPMMMERLPLVPEMFVNNILSGPITHAVNNVGNALANLYAPIEHFMGNMLTRQWREAGKDLVELASTPLEMADSVKIAYHSLRADAPILTADQGTRDLAQNRRAWSAAGQMVDPDSLQGMMLDHVGKVVNIPSRLLLAEDELWKQLAYRRLMRRRIMEIAVERFPDTASRSNFITQQMDLLAKENSQLTKDALFERGLREAKAKGLPDDAAHTAANDFVSAKWDAEVGRAAAESVQESRMMTWQNEPNVGKRPFKSITQRTKFKLFGGRGLRGEIGAIAMNYQMFARRHPYLQFITPFVRTPTNLLQYFLDRSFGAVTDNLGLMVDDLRGRTTSKATRRDIRGRLATAVTFTGTAAYLATSTNEDGLPLLTGSGPKDPDERRHYESLGWQQYSFYSGGKYISYRRLDPFATFLSTVADVIQTSQHEEALGQAPNYLKNAALAIIDNLSDKSYLTGLSSVFSIMSSNDKGADLERIIKQYARAMAPASSFVTQVVNPAMSDDKYILEVRTAHDAFVRALPLGNKWGNIEKKRDLFGDFIEVPAGIGPDWMSPLRYTEVRDDIVSRELAAVGATFGPPQEVSMNRDWTTYRNEQNKQTAYDRYLELHGEVRIQGKSMKQAMRMLIESPGYKRLSPIGSVDMPSPRVKELSRIKNLFRTRAQEQTLREYPKLLHDVQAFAYNKRLLGSGGTPEDFVPLIERN